MCDLLNQEVFSPCHEYISPAPFQRQCRADTCKCGTPCLCSALAHYARHCRKFSVIVEFRSHVPDCGECVLRRCYFVPVPVSVLQLDRIAQ